jgi:hypothetical protein
VAVVAGCAVVAAVASAMTPSGDPPLVELTTTSGRNHVTELRVRADGRFELRTVPQAWGLISTYTPAELAELRGEMERANEPPLPAVVKAQGVVSHPVHESWRLQLAGGPREVVVEHYRAGAVPRLDRLYRKLFTIPRAVKQESQWRVRVKGEIVRRRVIGEPAFIDALEPMLAALYDRPDALDAVGPGTVPERLLVDVRYLVDGKRGDRLAVTAHGRAFLTERGKTMRLRSFDDGELATLRRAIERTRWPKLPDPVTQRAG